VAVLNPLLHQVAAQPPAYPAVQVPDDGGRFDQSKVASPSSQVGVQLFDNLKKADPFGPACDLLDPVFEVLRGLVCEFDLPTPIRDEAKSQKPSLRGPSHRTLLPVALELELLPQKAFDGLHHPPASPFGTHIDVTCLARGDLAPRPSQNPA